VLEHCLITNAAGDELELDAFASPHGLVYLFVDWKGGRHFQLMRSKKIVWKGSAWENLVGVEFSV
jgi:hypothetical protein